MAFAFNKNVEEKMEWAYQQYVVNMAIHSRLVDYQKCTNHQKSGNGEEKGEELKNG
jgi:hypothetical protein